MNIQRINGKLNRLLKGISQSINYASNFAIEWEIFERLFENFHETAKETILQWSDVGHYVFVCLGVYPSPTRIALKRIATCKGGCGSSKPLGIYRTPFQPCFGLPLPHCCLHRSTLSCTVQECNVTTYVLSPSSWTFVFCAKLYTRIIYVNKRMMWSLINLIGNFIFKLRECNVQSLWFV